MMTKKLLLVSFYILAALFTGESQGQIHHRRRGVERVKFIQTN